MRKIRSEEGRAKHGKKTMTYWVTHALPESLSGRAVTAFLLLGREGPSSGGFRDRPLGDRKVLGAQRKNQTSLSSGKTRTSRGRWKLT